MEAPVHFVDDLVFVLDLLPGGGVVSRVENVHEVWRDGGQHNSVSVKVLLIDLKWTWACKKNESKRGQSGLTCKMTSQKCLFFLI